MVKESASSVHGFYSLSLSDTLSLSNPLMEQNNWEENFFTVE